MRYTAQLQVQDLRAKPVVDTRTEISILETEWIYCGPIPHPSGVNVQQLNLYVDPLKDSMLLGTSCENVRQN